MTDGDEEIRFSLRPGSVLSRIAQRLRRTTPTLEEWEQGGGEVPEHIRSVDEALQKSINAEGVLVVEQFFAEMRGKRGTLAEWTEWMGSHTGLGHSPTERNRDKRRRRNQRRRGN